MTQTTVGVLHPGQMGASIAASARKGGCRVLWASEGRSRQTRERAETQGLIDVLTPARLCAEAEIVFSVCPPHAAEDVAGLVRDCGFAGLYVDANAISPERAKGIGRRMTEAGIDFVDGGIIGPPAWKPDSTWLYLSGSKGARVAECFTAGPLRAHLLGDLIGRASALKMCYAAWTKGMTALLCAILAAAEELDVWDDLAAQWAHDWPGFDVEAVDRVRGVTAKAWRFAGEMDEIAATLAGAGMPGGFHAAAADIYRRLASFKDAPARPELRAVLAALRASN